MKIRLLIIGVMFSIANLAFAQDKIVKQSGDTLYCKVTDVLEKSIKYKYPNEDLTSTIYQSQISQIIFSSGRTQSFSEKITVNSEADWEKVILTNIPEEVAGLVRKGEVNGKATGAWGAASNAKKVYMKAEEKLKKEAARLGAHIIFTKDLIVKDGDMMTGQWAKSMLGGIAYGYK